jgi:hypothetical protein
MVVGNRIGRHGREHGDRCTEQNPDPRLNSVSPMEPRVATGKLPIH